MSAAAVDIAAVAAAAPQSDEELLSSMGLSQSLAAELLSSSEELMERYGADTTVEKFLEAHCNAHVRLTRQQHQQRFRVHTVRRLFSPPELFAHSCASSLCDAAAASLFVAVFVFR